MSLIRQLSALVVLSLLCAFVGGMGAAGGALTELLRQQLLLKNADNAQALSLTVSQQGGDETVIRLLMSAQFDTGSYQSLRWRRADGSVAFERSAPVAPSQAPAWLRDLVSLDAPAGVAQVSNGWQSLGQLELSSHDAYAYDALWTSLLRTASVAGLVALASLGLAQWLLGRIRRPLDALVAQADALADGQFNTVTPSRVRELGRLTEALNAMVVRLKRMFEAQTEQLGLLRQQAHCDALTGLSLRKHFLAEMASALARDDGPERGHLFLLRLRDLARVNQMLGRQATDDVLALAGEALRHLAQALPGALCGRLNGADLVVWRPATDTLEAAAHALMQTVQAHLQRAANHGGHSAIRLALGGVALRRSVPLSQWFAQADAALADAEHSSSAWSTALRQPDDEVSALPQGERAWRAQIEAALAQGQLRLAAYPVLDGARHLLHWECPLHLGLGSEGQLEFAPAKTWLPLAQRTGLTVEIDLAAVSAALSLVQQDGQQRCVNLAPASLSDPAFLGRLRALLRSQPAAARQLGLELDAEAGLRHFELVQELSRAVHPLGVRVGLEHAGANLQRIERLYLLGLDFVKLDRSVVVGVAEDPARAAFVRSLVVMLRSLSLTVVAEGVDDPLDAQILLDCGLHGLTGPWATQHRDHDDRPLRP